MKRENRLGKEKTAELPDSGIRRGIGRQTGRREDGRKTAEWKPSGRCRELQLFLRLPGSCFPSASVEPERGRECQRIGEPGEGGFLSRL